MLKEQENLNFFANMGNNIREKNCALFIWTTMPCLPEVFKVITAWGFKYKTCAFTWVKTKKDGQPLSGMGSYTKANAELCLLFDVVYMLKCTDVCRSAP